MRKKLFVLICFIFIISNLLTLNEHKIENDHAGGNLGYRTALDGDFLATSKYCTSSRAGGVRIYNRNLGGENNWGEEDYLYSPVSPGAGDYFGDAIDLYGDLLIVGRYGGSDPEKAFIFKRQQDPWTLEWEWEEIRTLDPSEAPEIDETEDNDINFGASVAINDEWVVVGAPLDNSENGTQPLVGDSAGAIYTWRKVDGVWTFYDKWTAYVDDVAEYQDKLGTSVDVWGDNIIVGAVNADIKDPDPPFDVKDDTGAAYLLYPSSGVWHLTTKLQAPYEDADIYDQFGDDVAIWGSRMIVGAPNHTGGGGDMSHYGAAFTFFRSGGVSLEHIFYDPDPQQASDFGENVDVYMNCVLISNEGQRRYYPDETPPGDYQVGVTYHYGLCSDAHFHLLHTLWPENYVTEHGDNYSCALAMDGSYYFCVGSFTDDDGAAGAGANYVYWIGDSYGEAGDGLEAEGDDGSGNNNGGSTGTGSVFPSPYTDCVIINEYEADPTAPSEDVQEWIELLVVAEDGVDMRNWLLSDVNPEDFYLDNTNPGYNDASIKFNDYTEFSNIPGGTTIVIFDGNGPTNDLDPSDGDMFIYTESDYLSRVSFSYYTIQLDETNDNITLWADDDGIWDVDNSLPIDHISWGDPLIGPPDGIEWEDYIDDGSENRSVGRAYFSSGDDTINDNAADWVTDGTSSQGTLNTGQTYTGSSWLVEPSNHVLDFLAEATGFYSVQASWVENDGIVPPDGYLLRVSTEAISDPVDGYELPEDTDLSDGFANVYLAPGTISHAFSNCSPLTTYYFKIYPYTGSSSLINYKLDGTIPSDTAITPTDILEPTPGDLIITEVVGDGVFPTFDYTGFIEFTNTTNYTINLANVVVRYYDDQLSPSSTCDLMFGTIDPGEYKVVCQYEMGFMTAYNPIIPDFIAPFNWGTYSPEFTMDGGNDIIDIYVNSSRSEVIDQFNDYTSPWSWNTTDVLERVSASNGALQASWTDPGGTGTPGTGPVALPSSPQNVMITISSGNVTITWDPVIDATSYKIYSSSDPESGFTEDTTGTFTDESWTAPVSDSKKFYHVKAVN